MSISLSCPSCEHALKVKDELAGRRVKCPKCGDAFTVPAEDEEGTAVAAGPAKKKSRPIEDEDEEQEDRPRKKKKKRKKKSNKTLLFAAGGGVLLVVIAVVVFFLMNQKEPAKKEIAAAPPVQPQRQAEQPAPQPKPGLIRKIKARTERPQRLNELRQIATFYQTYAGERGKPPNNLDDFINYIKRDAPAIVQAIKEDYYVVVMNVRGSGVVAYEKDPDIFEMHGVAMSDASVDGMPTQRLQEALKAQGAQ